MLFTETNLNKITKPHLKKITIIITNGIFIRFACSQFPLFFFNDNLVREIEALKYIYQVSAYLFRIML